MAINKLIKDIGSEIAPPKSEDEVIDEFREKINDIDWTKFENKKVLIKGCSQAPIPIWAYLIISSNLATYAKKIYFGEARRAIEIYSKN